MRISWVYYCAHVCLHFTQFNCVIFGYQIYVSLLIPLSLPLSSSHCLCVYLYVFHFHFIKLLLWKVNISIVFNLTPCRHSSSILTFVSFFFSVLCVCALCFIFFFILVLVWLCTISCVIQSRARECGTIHRQKENSPFTMSTHICLLSSMEWKEQGHEWLWLWVLMCMSKAKWMANESN